jgi:hypothetical protein
MLNERLRGDSGAALLETALIAPVLFLFFAGILEYGLVYRDYLTVSDGAAYGAKVGSIQGKKTDSLGYTADFTIARDVRQSTASVPPEWIEKIVVFRSGPPSAGGALAQVPAACKTSPDGVQSSCNVYPTIEAFLAVQAGDGNYFKCIPPANSGRACKWDPQTRRDGPTVSQIQYLGVYIKLKRPYITGLFGTELDIEVAAVQRLEPGDLDG